MLAIARAALCAPQSGAQPGGFGAVREHPQRHCGKKITTQSHVGRQLCPSLVAQTRYHITHEGIHAPVPGPATVADPGSVAAHGTPAALLPTRIHAASYPPCCVLVRTATVLKTAGSARADIR